MEKYLVPIQLRWADIDQNRHLRHSAYYDFGALTRMTFLNAHGLTTEKMEELKIGPVLFREEAIFKREIKFEDKITLDIEIVKATADFSRWSIRHHVTKADGTIAAVIQVDGAWIDLVRRKLAAPNEFIQTVFKDFPMSPEFETIPAKV
jgi:acyl-CoA thioester hydrolase